MKKEKILTFIIKDKKILLLLESDKDPQFHESFWYTVTGSKEEIDKDLFDTVRRETKEETNLNLTNIISLNWKLEYESLGEDCIEYIFVSYAEDINNIKLNEESIDYKWCGIDEFITLIKWYYDKNELKETIQNYLKKDVNIV